MKNETMITRNRELYNIEDIIVLETMGKAVESGRYKVSSKKGVLEGKIYTMTSVNLMSEDMTVSLARDCFGLGKSHIKVWGKSEEKILAFAKYCGFEYEEEWC